MQSRGYGVSLDTIGGEGSGGWPESLAISKFSAAEHT